MFVLDYSGVMHSNIAAQVGFKGDVTVDEGLIRHMILNTIRSLNSKFRNDHGELVIAFDGKPYWRSSAFPYYKANRKKSRKESVLDWNTIWKSMDAIKAELKEFMPYRAVEVAGAEADDVIGTLVRETSEPVVIISRDDDFVQLHPQLGNRVTQWDPVGKKWVKTVDPKRALLEKIVKGDVGDGIPNVMSPDDCLVTGVRQKPITQKRLDMFCAELPEGRGEIEHLRNFRRNEQLIDLSRTPPEIKAAIVDSFTTQSGKDRTKIMNYFLSKKLKNLMEAIGDF